MLNRIDVPAQHVSSMEEEPLGAETGRARSQYVGGIHHFVANPSALVIRTGGLLGSRSFPSYQGGNGGGGNWGGGTNSVHSAHSAHSYHSGFSHGFAAANSQNLAPARITDARTASDHLISLKRDREREGRCADCGAQTHEFMVDPVTGSRNKEPLTISGEVRRGRCLLCHPLVGLPVDQGGGGELQMAQTPSVGGAWAGVHDITDIPSVVPSVTGGTLGFHRHSQRSSGFGGVRPIDTESSQCSGDISMVNSAPSCGKRSRASRRPMVGASASSRAMDCTPRTFPFESADLCDIIATMRQYPQSSPIQTAGCEKLWIQSWEDENSSAIGRVGGIPTIVDAMRHHPCSLQLQQCGARALQNLSINEYNREIVAECGGAASVVKSMLMHWDDLSIQQCGCTALGNIAADSVDNRATVAECGGLHAILVAVETFPQEETVLRSAYQALRVLGYNPTQVLAEHRRGTAMR